MKKNTLEIVLMFVVLIVLVIGLIWVIRSNYVQTEDETDYSALQEDSSEDNSSEENEQSSDENSVEPSTEEPSQENVENSQVDSSNEANVENSEETITQ